MNGEISWFDRGDNTFNNPAAVKVFEKFRAGVFAEFRRMNIERCRKQLEELTADEK